MTEQQPEQTNKAITSHTATENQPVKEAQLPSASTEGQQDFLAEPNIPTLQDLDKVSDPRHKVDDRVLKDHNLYVDGASRPEIVHTQETPNTKEVIENTFKGELDPEAAGTSGKSEE